MSRAAIADEKSLAVNSADERLMLGTALATLAASFLWLWVLILEWPRLAAGPLCGEAVGIFGHCPLCYPAAGFTALAVAGGLVMLDRRRRARRQTL